MLDRPPADRRMPGDSRDYLSRRLDGARDLYLLALALGVREDGRDGQDGQEGHDPDGRGFPGRMILEARIHFASVIEECRIAGLEIGDLQRMLGTMNRELVDSIRPEIWEHLTQLLEHGARKGGRKERGR
jgi:hypothetical protein